MRMMDQIINCDTKSYEDHIKIQAHMKRDLIQPPVHVLAA